MAYKHDIAQLNSTLLTVVITVLEIDQAGDILSSSKLAEHVETQKELVAQLRAMGSWDGSAGHQHADARRVRYHFISIWRRSTTRRYAARNGLMRCSL